MLNTIRVRTPAPNAPSAAPRVDVRELLSLTPRAPWAEADGLRRRAPREVVSSRPMHRQRVPLNVLAEGRAGDRYVVGWLLDLSMGGLFLRSPTPFAVGERVSLEFCLPGTATVVRCQGEAVTSVEAGKWGPGGNRFEFRVLRPAHARAIARFINLAIEGRHGRVGGTEVEISLLGPGALEALGDLPPAEASALGVDALPDVGGLLEELRVEDPRELTNDVGALSPDDLILVS